MLGFDKAGGYAGESFWEYAPLGRPHLYPPLFHILELLFYKAGAGKIVIARFFTAAVFPLSLAVIWLVLRYVWTSRLAFFSILVAISSFSFYLSTVNNIPATLSILCGFLSYLCVEKKKTLSGVIFLGFAFYLHAIMPWIIAISFLLYSIANRERAAGYRKAVFFAILASLPVLAHQVANVRYIRLLNVPENQYLSFNLIIFVLAIAGAIICLSKKGKYYYPVILAASFFLLAPFYAHRFLCGQGIIGFILLASVALDFIYEKIVPGRFWAYIAVIVILLLISPGIEYGPDNGFRIRYFDSSLVRMMSPSHKPDSGKAGSIFFPKFYDEIVSSIRENSAKNDIIWSNFNYFGGVLGVLADRATSSAMLAEVMPRKDFDEIAQASLIIWLKDPDNVKSEPRGMIDKYNLHKIEETDIAFIYRNSDATARSAVSGPVVPNKIMFLLFFMSIGLVIFDIIYRRFRGGAQ